MPSIPRIYQEPVGVPLYWMNEQSGNLRQAVMAYLEGREDNDQRAWVIEYIRYVLDAPCWRGVERLRAEAAAANSRKDLETLFDHCLEVGIDPL